MSSILDVWSDPITSGIFTVLNNYDVPWKSDNIYESLNLTYYYNHSGQKNIGPLVTGILSSNTTLTDDNKTKIGKLVYDVCHMNWEYLYNALFAEYNPIENYAADETETVTEKGSKTGVGTETNTGTDNAAHSGNDTLTKTGTDAHVESGTDTGTESGTDTFKDSGTDTTTDSGTDTFTDSGTDKKTNTGTDTVTNSGDDITKNTGTVKNENVNDNGKSETKNQIYGYNSTEAADDSTSTTTVNQTITDTRTDDTTSTLTHGLSTLDTQNLKESMDYGKSTSENKNMSSSTQYGKDTTEIKNMSNSTTYGHTDTENIDISEKSTYNSSNDRTLNLSKSTSDTENTTGDSTRTLNRHGNIGVTTTQQMIESEIELRKRNFFEIVFKDIDNYLTLAVY